MDLNGFNGVEHHFIRADCTDWLKRGGGGQKYRLIFFDPPSFFTSKWVEATIDLQCDHVDLIWGAARLLEPEGVLIFSNHLRRFHMD